jgi:hypothetical protein
MNTRKMDDQEERKFGKTKEVGQILGCPLGDFSLHLQ